MTFQPLTSYAGYEHVLNAVPCFIHPGNHNLYGIAIEKVGDVRQDLSVYRVRPGVNARELVHRYLGGSDSAAQIAAGGCVIHPDGSLEVWASAVPVAQPDITKTGFVGGFWPRIPNIDAPYTYGAGPAGPIGPKGSGSPTLFPAPLTSAEWNGRQVSGGVDVDIPAVFGAPSASGYLIRFVAVAAAPNVRVRAGTQPNPYFLTLNTQIPNVEVHTQGWAPGPHVYVSTVNGPASVWLQVIGY
jgi:hypothetical protein